MVLGIILSPYGQIPGAYPNEIAYSYGGDGTFLCPDDPYYNTRGEPGFYHDTQLGTITEILTPTLTLLNTRDPAPQPKRQPIRSGGGPTLKGPGFFARLRAKRVRKALHGLGLGSIPTDFDLAPTYGWVPMIDGWVAAKEGFQPGRWVPPNGWQPAGIYSPQLVPRVLNGLGDGAQITVPTPTISASPEAQAAADAAAASINMTLQEHQDRMFKLTIISTTIVGLSALIATIRTWKQLKRDEKLFLSRSGS